MTDQCSHIANAFQRNFGGGESKIYFNENKSIVLDNTFHFLSENSIYCALFYGLFFRVVFNGGLDPNAVGIGF